MNNFLTLTFLLLSTMLTSQNTIDAISFANTDRYHESNVALRSKQTKVVFIGNSITEGWVTNMPDFFTSNNYVGRGISGQTSSQLLLRFREDVIELKPLVVVINAGTNDVAENTGAYNESFTLGNIASMVQIAEANNVKVILSSVLPATEFNWRTSVKNVSNKIVSLNEGIKKLAELYKLPYLDYHTTLKNKNNGLDFAMANDGVHPTLACYEIMSDMAQNIIQQTLDK